MTQNKKKLRNRKKERGFSKQCKEKKDGGAKSHILFTAS